MCENLAPDCDSPEQIVERQPGLDQADRLPGSNDTDSDAMRSAVLAMLASVLQDDGLSRERVIVPRVTTSDVGAAVRQGYRAGLYALRLASGRFASAAERTAQFSRRVEGIAVDRLGDDHESA